jgi:hypothetical protein
MKKITKEKLENILSDWDVSSCGDGDFELSSHSPAGENVVMSLVGDTFYDMARFASSYYDDFDPQDHAAQIYHAKHYGTAEEQRFFAGAPDDLEDLLEDAKAIDEMYYSVYQKLCKAYEEDQDDGDDSEEE